MTTSENTTGEVLRCFWIKHHVFLLVMFLNLKYLLSRHCMHPVVKSLTDTENLSAQKSASFQ